MPTVQTRRAAAPASPPPAVASHPLAPPSPPVPPVAPASEDSFGEPESRSRSPSPPRPGVQSHFNPSSQQAHFAGRRSRGDLWFKIRNRLCCCC